MLAVVDEILKNYDGSTGAKDNVKRVIITIEEKFSTLKAFDKSILAAIDDDETMDAEIEESEEFRGQIHDAVVKLQRFGNAQSEMVSHQGGKGWSTPVIASNTRLNKLNLKRFTGDPKEWQSFWDSLSLAVHTNSSLTSVDKFLGRPSLAGDNRVTFN